MIKSSLKLAKLHLIEMFT